MMNEGDNLGERMRSAQRQIENTLAKVIPASLQEVAAKNDISESAALIAAAKACVCAGLMFFSGGSEFSSGAGTTKKVRDEIDGLAGETLGKSRRILSGRDDD